VSGKEEAKYGNLSTETVALVIGFSMILLHQWGYFSRAYSWKNLSYLDILFVPFRG